MVKEEIGWQTDRQIWAGGGEGPAPPSPHTWGMAQATEWKSCLICFTSFICETGIQSLVFNWNLRIFDLLAPPEGVGKNKSALAPTINVSNSHLKFGSFSTNGLGGDNVMNRRTIIGFENQFWTSFIIKTGFTVYHYHGSCDKRVKEFHFTYQSIIIPLWKFFCDSSKYAGLKIEERNIILLDQDNKNAICVWFVSPAVKAAVKYMAGQELIRI